MKRILARFALIAVVLVLGVAIAAIAALNKPFAAFPNEVILEIPRGSSTREIAALLQSQGVIASQWHFLAARAIQPRATLQAGEYRFFQPASPLQVLSRIARGDIYFYEVIFPEGSSLFDIAQILETQGNIKGADFIKAARNPQLIRDLAPKAPTLEGYLFPATYRITRHTTAEQLSKEMTTRFRRAWKSLQPTADVHSTVTLASLVEKETAVPTERPVVASVYRNRLDRGIKLDCDPTTIYAALLEGRYRGTIYRSDLDNPHPFNTYQHAGLPPGPIANPGLLALKAALQPASTDFLFFVAKADGSGGHVFSSNIEAHNRAVAEYRRGQQKGKAISTTPTGTRQPKGRSD